MKLRCLAAGMALVVVACLGPAPGKLVHAATAEAECAGLTKKACRIVRATQDLIAEAKLRSVIVRVAVGGQPILTRAFGRSMTGVRATADMHFRNGAVAIAYLGSLALQLQDDGLLDLDQPIGKWLPDFPNSGQVTPRMLLNGTSGYRDYVPMKAFADTFYANPFRRFTQDELLAFAFTKPPLFEPGTNFSYAHTNFVTLGMAIERATGASVETLMRQRIIRPMGLGETDNPRTPEIAAPVLHVFTKERGGPYEESTFWNPSWTLPTGAIMTTDITDLERSARLVGTGAFLSKSAFAQMLEPLTAGFAPWSRERYYGLGVLVRDGWILQTPSFHGCAGVMAYLPTKDISIGIVSTRSRQSDVERNYSIDVLSRITKIMSPDNILEQ